ncbi:phage baseplate assembly protein V [Veronia nyctiphanis]|nr:phage baseplate assembly protein V [Veronia nyctiphanis]
MRDLNCGLVETAKINQPTLDSIQTLNQHALMSLNTSELFRRFENLVRIGTIAAVEHKTKQLRIQSGELLTDWLDWPAEMGRNYIRWRPLRLGTQVVFVCPSGDPAQALIVSILYSNQLDTPSTNEAIDLIQFDDGTHLSYNIESGLLDVTSIKQISLRAQHINIKGTSSFEITSPKIQINGPITQQNGDITSDGISVQQHTHISPESKSPTGTPQ